MKRYLTFGAVALSAGLLAACGAEDTAEVEAPVAEEADEVEVPGAEEAVEEPEEDLAE